MRKLSILFTAILILLLASSRVLADGGLAPVPGTSGGAGDGEPATTITSYVLSCSGLTMTGRTGSDHVVVYSFGNLQNFPASNGSYSVSIAASPPENPGDESNIEVWGETNTSTGGSVPDWDGHGWTVVDYQACPASWNGSSAAGGVTFFDPADGRIDGKPGDRIAVWCNTTATPPTLVVYGVGDASNGTHGFWLGTFNNADLLKAGATGITKNAGAGNGTISAMEDSGNFWVAWNGGVFGATGNPPFAKAFACQF